MHEFHHADELGCGPATETGLEEALGGEGRREGFVPWDFGSGCDVFSFNDFKASFAQCVQDVFSGSQVWETIADFNAVLDGPVFRVFRIVLLGHDPFV